jgi:hypothetical protein
MDPLHAAIAFGPVAAYLLALSRINLRRHPTVISGISDTAALAFAVTGLLAAGPLELLLPETAAAQYRGLVWLWMFAIYILSVILWLLTMRPSIVVYNATAEDIRPALTGVALQLDKESLWTGDSLLIPAIGVQLHLEPTISTKNVTLVPTGPRQSYQGWGTLREALAEVAPTIQSGSNPTALAMMIMATAMALFLSIWLASEGKQVVRSLQEMMRL